nr:MAG TPA: hypothetical protein [Bacteriophage sp.]
MPCTVGSRLRDGRAFVDTANVGTKKPERVSCLGVKTATHKRQCSSP